ncbi:nuclear transport factor 2 family protein [Undibacterium jejuense]|uniref:Nuclear transport factor 2 family protein n=1 Tax=Undibacterium jejuense TaxID=1344949 RepID=A0A923HQM8_9BURK|nr:nuclear transport factor 2 family protein [Undibacterium jejuense]MBC3862913.1 nuclear transport factor 2 family protein [Undibacterium jejuense]
MKKLLGFISLLSFLVCLPVVAEESQVQTIQKLNQFIDEWHDDAAHSRMAYFDKIAKDGVYIGTDKTERWTREDFKVWAKPAFARPSAWAFKVLDRHVAMTIDQSVIWFDEQLQTQMGICQASGVVRNTSEGFQIEHYQLSLTVPNDLIDYLSEGVKKNEQKQKNSP